jgi:hypothetical protein
MWDIDNFPGADHVPWQLLIRARLVHELDAVIASAIVRQVSEVASSKVAHVVARAAQEAVVDAHREEASPEQRIAAFDAMLDFDDWCGTPPHRWPGPRPHFDDLSDPISEVVLRQAFDLVQRAGSERLQKTLGPALQELSPALA